MFRSLLLACGLLAATLHAGSIIVGSTSSGASPVGGGPASGPLYQINTTTGATTSSGPNGLPYQMTGGTVPNTLIMWSPINAYQLDLTTGKTLLSPTYLLYPAANVNGTFYGIFKGFLARQTMYFCENINNCQGPPQPTFVGDIALPDTTIFDYAPATGLLALSGNSLYSVNTQTAAITLLTQLSLTPNPNGITPYAMDFAYDDATGKIILAMSDHLSGTSKANAVHTLYSVDLHTGLGTILTTQGPEFLGLARVDFVPESPTLLLFAIGLALFGLARAKW